MSRIRNTKKSNHSRKNFKIESLEPRLLMDANGKNDNWYDEINSISAPNLLDDNDALYEKIKGKKSSESITGLYQRTKESIESGAAATLDDFSDSVSYDDLVKMDQEFTSSLPQPTAKEILKEVKKDLVKRVKRVDSDEKMSAKQLFEKLCAQSGSVESEGVTCNIQFQHEDSVNSWINVNYSIKYVDSKIKVEVRSYASLEDYGRNLGMTYRDYAGKIKANLRDFDGIDIDANFNFAGYTRVYDFSFYLDGKKDTSAKLSSTVMLCTMFDESHEKVSVGEDAQYGILGFNGDTDLSVDLMIGCGVTINESSKNGSPVNGVLVDLDLTLKNASLFTKNTGLKKYVSYSKDFFGAGVWRVDSSNKTDAVDVGKYNQTTMGRIFSTLLSLSAKLAEVQNGEYGNADFNGLLSRNCHNLLELSRVLEHALIVNLGTENARSPLTIQEMIANLNAVNEKKGKSYKFKIDMDEEGNLVIPFELDFYLTDSKNVEHTTVNKNVALAQETLESLLGVKVTKNALVNVASSGKLSFNMVIPLESYSLANKNTTLKELGIDSSDCQIGLLMGANSMVAPNSIDFKYGSNFETNVMGCALAAREGGSSYCLDAQSGIYALYSEKEINLDALKVVEEFADAKVQKGFVFEWNASSPCKKITAFGKSYDVDGIEHAVNTLNTIFEESADVCDFRAMVIGDKIVVLFDADVDADAKNLDKEWNSLKKVSLVAGNDSYNFENLLNIVVSGELSLASYVFADVFAVTIPGLEDNPSAPNPVFISFSEDVFADISSVSEVASRMQALINNALYKTYGKKYGKGNLENLIQVQCFDNRIRVVSNFGFQIHFTPLFGKWLGFAENENLRGVVDDSDLYIYSPGYDLKNSCIRIETSKGEYFVQLKSLVDAQIYSGSSLKNLSVNQILKAIETDTNGKIVVDSSGKELKAADGGSIKSIEDYGGFSIASMLGLTGIYSTNTEEGRTSFDVDAYLINEYQGTAAIRFENVEMVLQNNIANGQVSVPAVYGSIGVNANGALSDLKCVSKGTLNSDGSWSFTYTYTNGGKTSTDISRSLDLTLDQPIKGEKSLGTLLLNTVDYDDKNKTKVGNELSIRFDKNIVLQNVIGGYSSGNVDIEDVYLGLYKKIEELKQYFAHATEEDSLLKGCSLPMYSKDILDIMGIRSKLDEISFLLSRNYNCSTVQQLSLAIKNKTGIDVAFKLDENGLSCDLTWLPGTIQQVVELEDLGLDIENFKLAGKVNAVLTANDLKFTAHIDLCSNLNFILEKSSALKPLITGTVSIKAENIDSDIILNVVSGGVCYTNEYHAGAGSSLNISATFGQDDEYNEIVAMTTSGVLCLSRLGLDAGEIIIGVAKADDDYVDLKEDSSFTYSLRDHIISAAAVWKKDGSDNILSVKKSGNKVVADSIVVDLRNVSGLREVQLPDRLCEAAEGLSTSIRRMQSTLLNTLVQEQMRSIPILGDSVINVGDCLDKLNEELVEPIRKLAYSLSKDVDGLDISKKISTMLKTSSSFYLADLGDCSKKSVSWAGKTFNGYYNKIQYGTDKDSEGHLQAAYWRIRLVGTFNLESNADIDLGFSGLGFNADGGVNLSVECVLDIGFGVSLQEGAFLLLSNGNGDTSYDGKENSPVNAEAAEKEALFNKTTKTYNTHAGDDFTAKIKIEPSGKIKGSLGFLTMQTALQEFTDGAGIIALGIDFNDGDNGQKAAGKDWTSDKNAKTLIDFDTLSSDLSIETGLRGKLPICLNLALGIGDDVEVAPHIETDFVLDWSSYLGMESPFGEISKIAYTGIGIDIGSFIEKIASPVLDKVKKVIDPIQPLIDFLQAEIPVLNKLPKGKYKKTVLDLIKEIGGDDNDFSFLDDLVSLTKNIKILSDFAKTGVWKLTDGIVFYENVSNREELNAKGLAYLNGNVTDKNEFAKNDLAALVSSENTSSARKNRPPQLNAAPSGEDEPSVNLEGNLIIPLLENPKMVVMELLVGAHVDLVQYDLAPLNFNFDWKKSFPIVGPLCADVGFNFGAQIDLCVGYDTFGMEEWYQSGCSDYLALIDGFYIADWDEKGNDVAEVVFRSGVVAGASIGGRVGVNVGLNLNVNLDFDDSDDDGKIRLGELISLDGLKNPFSLFDISATLEFKAFAYLDYFFGRKKWTLWSLGALDLFKSSHKSKNYNTDLAGDNGGETVVYVGQNAGHRKAYDSKHNNDTSDGNDDVLVTITSADTVNVSWRKKDASADGTMEENYKFTENNVKIGEGKTLAIYSGEGSDHVIVRSNGGTAQFNIKVYGQNGDDTIDMQEAAFASGYTAVVMGGKGSNAIYGAQGADNFLFADEGVVTYDKAGSDDKKRVVKAEAYQIDESAGLNVIYGGSAFNVIFGTAGSDVIVGGDGTNYIFGDSGRYRNKNGEVVVDREDLFVEGGNDIIYGGNGEDHIFGGAGNDTIFGLAGYDEIHGGQGNDIIYGGSGNDVIYGDDGADIVFGDSPIADLHIASSDGKGTLPYIFVPDELKTKDGDISLPSIDSKIKSDTGASLSDDDEIHGGNGSDILYGDKGAMTASGGKDVIYGDAGDDFVNGDGGNDTLYGNYGMDVLYGGAGDDTLDGGAGDDFVFGKNGEIGYKALSKESVNKWVGEGRGSDSDFVAAYGDMLRVAGQHFGIGSNSKYGQDDGDDTIIAGEGNDFVDGQTGNDVYKIYFQGGNKKSRTNVMDSGNDSFDKINVFGTENDENVVISVSDDGLAKIATRKNEKGVVTELERVNFWGNALEFASLETGVGNDFIYVECTPCIMEIDAGGGNDSIHIGGVNYMKPSDNSNVNPLDVYDASVIQTVSGSLSIGASHALSVKAGSGDDSITVDHTSAALTLYGNMGDDTFTLNSHTYMNKGVEYGIENLGRIAIVGGGNDGGCNSEVATHKNKVRFNGLPYSSKYFIVGHHLLSSNMNVNFSGVGDLYVRGGEDIDSFWLRDMAALNYDIDSSSFGDDVTISWLVENDEKGNSDILGAESILKNQINKDSQHEKIQVKIYDWEGQDITDNPYVRSGDFDEYIPMFATITYGLCLSDKPEGTVKIRIRVPNISDDDCLRGARDVSIRISGESAGGDYCELTFDKNNYNKIQYVTVENKKLSYLQREDLLSSYHEVITSSEKDEVEAPCVLLSFGDAGFLDEENGFTETIQRRISECKYDEVTGRYSVTITVNPGFKESFFKDNQRGGNGDNCHWEIGRKIDAVYYTDGVDWHPEVSLSGTELTLSWDKGYSTNGRNWINDKLDPDDVLYFNYVTDSWYLDNESSALLRSSMDDIDPYDESLKKQCYEISLLVDGESNSRTLGNDPNTSFDDKYFYKEQGHRIIICSKETGEAVSVSGYLRIEFVEENYVKPADSPINLYSAHSFVDSFHDHAGKESDLYNDPRGIMPYIALHVPETGSADYSLLTTSLWRDLDFDWLGEKGTADDRVVQYSLPSRDEADMVYIYLQDNSSRPYHEYESRLSAYYSNEPGK